MNERFGDWFLTYTGKQFYPLDPHEEDICTEDVAHALSNLCRFGGHCETFYSVAQHCVLVSRLVAREFALLGLLHDATEAYCMDIVRPLKYALPNYIAIEERIWEAICEHYSLDSNLILKTKDADNVALVTERRDVLPPLGPEWELSKQYKALPERIVPLCPEDSERMFLDRFYELNK